MTIRSSVLDRTCPNPNFRCSTWAPWEYVLEAIEFLRLLLGCSAGGMTCRLGMDGMFGQLYHGDGNNLSKSGAICRAGRSRRFPGCSPARGMREIGRASCRERV